MAKRIVLHVTFDRKVGLWVLKQTGNAGIITQSPYKKMLISEGRIAARSEWFAHERPSQLVVHGKDGRVNFESTYGKDPKRYPS